MALKAVVDAVEARLAANWTLCPVIGANGQGETPDDGSAFLTVQYPVANASQTTIGAPGSNVFREEGAIRFVLNVPRGAGLATGLTWADTLAGLFRSKIIRRRRDVRSVLAGHRRPKRRRNVFRPVFRRALSGRPVRLTLPPPRKD
jgi:hypothetical protein